MKKFTPRLIFAYTIILCSLFFSNPVRGQISADGSLSTNVNQSGNVFKITGGAQAGTNLFHSFGQFSLPTGFEAFFNNGLAIENIISRVTGGFLSNIDGLIRANGGANFILINPSGINFGPNARLDIGGSFLGSTANSIVFEDGTVFSATPTQEPLLTVSVPIGLQWGANVAPIQVQGANLAVGQGQTLALIGGDVKLEGGTLTASQGNIDLGAVAGNSMVTITSINTGWVFGYDGVQNFSNIELSQQAQVTTSGNGGGDIQVTGNQITLTELSNILAETKGNQNAGNIDVQATQLKVENGSSITSSSLNGSSGNGGILNIKANEIIVKDGGKIFTATNGSGKAGEIFLDADLVKVSNSPSNRILDGEGNILFSTIGARSRGEGNAGNIFINTGVLITEGGGDISVSSLKEESPGIPGNISINATGSVELNSGDFNPNKPDDFSRSGIFAGSSSINDGFNSQITVNTPSLTISNGARISASTRIGSSGKGANIEINANSINLDGVFSIAEGRTFPSAIAAQSGELVGSSFVEPSSNQGSEISNVTGDGGNINIKADEVIVKDGGIISTSTFGNGNAGSIFIDAKLVQVSNSTLDKNDNIFFSSIESRSENLENSNNLGNSGDIEINTGQIIIEDGADVSVSALDSDSSALPGSVTIYATEFIQLDGVGFNPQNVTQFSRSGIFATNNSTGDGSNSQIEVNTPRLTITNGARISTDPRGSGSDSTEGGKAANIVIDANFIELTGLFTIPDTERTFRSGLFSEPGGGISEIFGESAENPTASGGNININADELFVTNGATISASTTSQGDAGKIHINTTIVRVSDSILDGNKNIVFSSIESRSRSQGNSGNIEINTDVLITEGGADIAVSALNVNSSAVAGDIIINATDFILLDGFGFVFNENNELQSSRSGIFSSTNGIGDGSDSSITVNTPRMTISNGARIATSTRGKGTDSEKGGTAPNIVINASFLELIGISPTPDENTSPSPSGVFANSGDRVSPLFVEGNNGEGLNPENATGNGGNLTVNAGNLILRDGAQISVSASGSGSAGNLNIATDSLFLDNSSIAGATALGEGGNIGIEANQSILRNESEISTTAGGGTGDGGDITITGTDFSAADFLTLLERSNIIANAEEGTGGNIFINTRGLFICADCQISASSELGIDGAIIINNPDVEIRQELRDLPENTINPEEQVALACARDEEESQFFIRGRGGLPPSPSEPLNSNTIRVDGKKPSQRDIVINPVQENVASLELPPPAQGWYTENGDLILTADAPINSSNSYKINQPNCPPN